MRQLLLTIKLSSIERQHPVKRDKGWEEMNLQSLKAHYAQKKKIKQAMTASISSASNCHTGTGLRHSWKF